MNLSRKMKVFLLLFAFLGGISLSGYAEITDKILVIVNDEVITQKEVDIKMAPVVAQYKTKYSEPVLTDKLNEAYDNAVQELIDDKLVLSEAKRKKIEVADKDIDQQVNAVKKRFKTEAEFSQALEQQGLTIQTLRENYKAPLMARKLVEREIGAKVTVTPTDMLNYYEQNKGKFIVPLSAKVRMILIKRKEGPEGEKSLDLAKGLLERIKKGENFAALAKAYSEGFYAEKGGEMGYVKKDELLPRIDEAIFKLKKGEVSDVIATDVGYHVFKVEDIRLPETLPFDTVSHDIEREIFMSKMKDKMTKLVNKLKETAYIEFK
jgi:parvulin-like peptidyl-prolyl isomerase